MTVRGGVHPGQVHVKYIKKLFGTFTPTANLESQTNLTCIFLTSGFKPSLSSLQLQRLLSYSKQFSSTACKCVCACCDAGIINGFPRFSH